MATATNGFHPAVNGAHTADSVLEIKAEQSTPADRWETVFIWAFILKFQSLKGKVEGLETIIHLEQAILLDDWSPVLHAVLAKFVENLAPKANTSVKNISSTLYTLIQEFCSTNERSVWWSYGHNKNINPFKSDMDFYTQPWETKLLILRQLVEWQLSHNATTRNWLDRAHGVVRGGHRKRSDDQPRPTLVPPDPEHTKEKLDYKPLGQDAARRRYWTVDDSPRIYISGNPWKASCPFHAISTTRDEYVAVIQALKDTTPPIRQGKRRSKLEAGHDELVKKLEEQLPIVEAELKRLEVVEEQLRIAREKALEEEAKQRAKEIQDAQNGTRTRNKAKPEYVYRPPPADGVVYDDGEEVDELDDDEYRDEPEPIATEAATPVMDEEEEYQLDDDDEDEPAPKPNGKKVKAKPEPKPRPSAASDAAIRRSGRATQKRSYAEDEPPVRGERRSARRQTITSRADDEDSDARPAKRSRMSSVGSSNAETSASGPAQASAAMAAISLNGATSAASAQTTKTLRPGEKAIETVPGKKRSKFWYYVVEADDEATADEENSGEGPKMEVDVKDEDGTDSKANGDVNGTDTSVKLRSRRSTNGVAS